MKKKKLFCGLLAGVMAATSLTGCADQQEFADNDGRISISMYMWNRSMFKELSSWLEQKFPDIDFTFQQGDGAFL